MFIIFAPPVFIHYQYLPLKTVETDKAYIQEDTRKRMLRITGATAAES